MVQTQIAVV